MGLTEIPAELPCTSLPQRWSVPRGTKIDPEPVPHMTFGTPKLVRKKRPIRNTLTDNRFVTSNIPGESLPPCRGLWGTLHIGDDIDCNTCLLWEC